MLGREVHVGEHVGLGLVHQHTELGPSSPQLGAADTKLWRAFFVIALIGAVGIVLLIGMSK